MNKEEITDVINKLNNPKNFNYYTNYGYAMSLLISDADTILEYIENLQQRIDKAIPMLDELEKEIQVILSFKIPITEIKQIKEILKGGNDEKKNR